MGDSMELYLLQLPCNVNARDSRTFYISRKAFQNENKKPETAKEKIARKKG